MENDDKKQSPSPNNNNGFKRVFRSGMEIHDLLEENLKVSEEILKLTKYIKKYVFWQRIFGWLKFFLILVPVALAIIYLPPFLNSISNSFHQIINLFNDPSVIQGMLLK